MINSDKMIVGKLFKEKYREGDVYFCIKVLPRFFQQSYSGQDLLVLCYTGEIKIVEYWIQYKFGSSKKDYFLSEIC